MVSKYEIIKSPVVSEKSTNMQVESKYVFDVAEYADKPAVKSAVESIFSVEVSAVNIMNRKGKKKIFKGRKGKRQDRKIAIVTLKNGQKIDLAAGF